MQSGLKLDGSSQQLVSLASQPYEHLAENSDDKRKSKIYNLFLNTYKSDIDHEKEFYKNFIHRHAISILNDIVKQIKLIIMTDASLQKILINSFEWKENVTDHKLIETLSQKISVLTETDDLLFTNLQDYKFLVSTESIYLNLNHVADMKELTGGRGTGKAPAYYYLGKGLWMAAEILGYIFRQALNLTGGVCTVALTAARVVPLVTAASVPLAAVTLPLSLISQML